MDTHASAPSPSTSPHPGTSTPPSAASEQARIRRERREAKIRAGGSARLSKITGVGGGRPPPDATAGVTPSPSIADTPTPDPEEVDISTHFPTPGQTQPHRLLSQPDTPQAPDDPMQALLQQLMGAGGPSLGGFTDILGSVSPPPPSSTAVPPPGPKWVFPVLHALFALALGLYCTLAYPLTGTKAQRLLAASGKTDEGQMAFPLFLAVFLTVEAALQSTRLLLNHGNPGGDTGMAPWGIVLGFLPPAYRGVIEGVVRYAGVWKRLVGDVGVVVFVVGVGGWIRGGGSE